MATAVGHRLERVGRESASGELGLKGSPWTADTPRMESSLSYRPATVESFAAALESRARNAALGATAFGLVVGGAVGAVPLMPVETVWNLPAGVGLGTALAGALAGGLIGRMLGNRRAAVHLLHAQTVLCQLHAQRATLAIWKLLRAREETSTRDEGLELAPLSTSPHPSPQPQPEPQREPDLVSSVDPIPEPLVSTETFAQAQPEPPLQQPPPPSLPVPVEPLIAVPSPPEFRPALLHAVPSSQPPASADTWSDHGRPEATAEARTEAFEPEPPPLHVFPPLQPQQHGLAAPPESDPEPPQVLPAAPPQPEPLDPWLAPPLAPPATSSS